MPETTYIIRFYHRDSSEIEEVEHTSLTDAAEHFRLFGEDDADLYFQIDLVEFDWNRHTEKTLETVCF